MKGNTRPIYYDLNALADTLSLSISTIQAMVRSGEFPQPRKLSGRRVAWLAREIEEWAEARPVSDLLPPPNCGNRKIRDHAQPAPQGSRKAA